MLIETCLASKQERHMVLPADTLISKPMVSVTHAITINAEFRSVWPWLVQMGGGRAGWYSYDVIDNGGQPSSWTIMTEYQQIKHGSIMPAIPGATDAFVVAEVEEPSHLVLTVDDEDGAIQVSWEFLLVSEANDCTRLIVRARTSPSWPTPLIINDSSSTAPIMIERLYDMWTYMPKPLLLGLAGFGHYLLEARMLRGIMRRAEISDRATKKGPG